MPKRAKRGSSGGRAKKKAKKDDPLAELKALKALVARQKTENAAQKAENAAQKQEALAAKDETIAHGLLAVVEPLSDPSNTYTPCTTSLLRLVAPWLVVLASHLPTVIIR